MQQSGSCVLHRGATMGMGLQRVEKTSHLCGNELSCREQRVYVERLAHMVRQDPPQQSGFDRGIVPR